MRITTERLVLRRLCEKDKARFQDAMRTPAIHEFYANEMGDARRVEFYFDVIYREYADRLYKTFAVADQTDDRLVGMLMIKEDLYFRRIELSYWIHEEEWNKGYATEAVKAAIRHCFHKYRRCRRIQAMTFNPASARVLEKAGMSYEGTLRQYIRINEHFYDMQMYSVLREEA